MRGNTALGDIRERRSRDVGILCGDRLAAELDDVAVRRGKPVPEVDDAARRDRQSGSIGGFYGNGIGGFHAVPFALDAVQDAAGKAVGLRGDDPATSVEPFTPDKRAMLTNSTDLETFQATWRFGD